MSFTDKINEIIYKVFSWPNNQDRMQYASLFVDRVLKVLIEHRETGCVNSDFRPQFGLCEMDLVDFVLNELYKHNLLRKETRCYIKLPSLFEPPPAPIKTQ